uniref:hAT-like transposase RNase-H fold domain-containing protein n=1 Tax=Chenopodium quinoa TaxID=63459 RepID=A0A803KUW4_CHEQI
MDDNTMASVAPTNPSTDEDPLASIATVEEHAGNEKPSQLPVPKKGFQMELEKKGEVIGIAVEKCLLEWGINKVMTITVDNASSNDVGVQYLRKRLLRWKDGTVLEGKFVHMHCATHILNLTIREGLKECDESIIRIRNAVRFLRSSPARLQKFRNNCVNQEQIESKRQLCLDVETRWNSTYLMLETCDYWEDDKKKCESLDSGEKLMAYGMRKKHDKCWENVDNINLMLYIAVVLDPRRKMHYVKWAINDQYDSNKATQLYDMVMGTLTSLYEHYAALQSQNVPSVSENIDLTSKDLENFNDWHDVDDYEFEKDIGGQTVFDKKK